jgi:hypothetical protein
MLPYILYCRPVTMSSLSFQVIMVIGYHCTALPSKTVTSYCSIVLASLAVVIGGAAATGLSQMACLGPVNEVWSVLPAGLTGEEAECYAVTDALNRLNGVNGVWCNSDKELLFQECANTKSAFAGFNGVSLADVTYTCVSAQHCVLVYICLRTTFVAFLAHGWHRPGSTSRLSCVLVI